MAPAGSVLITNSHGPPSRQLLQAGRDNSRRESRVSAASLHCRRDVGGPYVGRRSWGCQTGYSMYGCYYRPRQGVPLCRPSPTLSQNILARVGVPAKLISFICHFHDAMSACVHFDKWCVVDVAVRGGTGSPAPRDGRRLYGCSTYGHRQLLHVAVEKLSANEQLVADLTRVAATEKG